MSEELCPDRWEGRQEGYGVHDGVWWARISPLSNEPALVAIRQRVVVLTPEVLAEVERTASETAWLEGHAAGRDYQADGWNSDAHDPREDNPYHRKETPDAD